MKSLQDYPPRMAGMDFDIDHMMREAQAAGSR